MIWIVSGHPRSGTSMMMQALMAGGMVGAWDSGRNLYLSQYEDAEYKANPDGCFEILHSTYDDPAFASTYAGKVVKVFHWGLPVLAAGEYRVLYMQRDPVEIWASVRALLRHRRQRSYPDVDQINARALMALAQRTDVSSVDVCDYNAMVADPRPTFERIAASGWPIDVTAAAAVVNPEHYRFRKDRLAA